MTNDTFSVERGESPLDAYVRIGAIERSSDGTPADALTERRLHEFIHDWMGIEYHDHDSENRKRRLYNVDDLESFTDGMQDFVDSNSASIQIHLLVYEIGTRSVYEIGDLDSE